MTHLQQLSWIVTDEILQICGNGKLPLGNIDEQQIADVENSEGFTMDELQDILSQRLPRTNCTLMRLPEYEIIKLPYDCFRLLTSIFPYFKVCHVSIQSLC